MNFFFYMNLWRWIYSWAFGTAIFRKIFTPPTLRSSLDKQEEHAHPAIGSYLCIIPPLHPMSLVTSSEEILIQICACLPLADVGSLVCCSKTYHDLFRTILENQCKDACLNEFLMPVLAVNKMNSYVPSVRQSTDLRYWKYYHSWDFHLVGLERNISNVCLHVSNAMGRMRASTVECNTNIENWSNRVCAW